MNQELDPYFDQLRASLSADMPVEEVKTLVASAGAGGTGGTSGPGTSGGGGFSFSLNSILMTTATIATLSVASLLLWGPTSTELADTPTNSTTDTEKHIQLSESTQHLQPGSSVEPNGPHPDGADAAQPGEAIGSLDTDNPRHAIGQLETEERGLRWAQVGEDGDEKKNKKKAPKAPAPPAPPVAPAAATNAVPAAAPVPGAAPQPNAKPAPAAPPAPSPAALPSPDGNPPPPPPPPAKGMGSNSAVALPDNYTGPATFASFVDSSGNVVEFVIRNTDSEDDLREVEEKLKSYGIKANLQGKYKKGKIRVFTGEMKQPGSNCQMSATEFQAVTIRLQLNKKGKVEGFEFDSDCGEMGYHDSGMIDQEVEAELAACQEALAEEASALAQLEKEIELLVGPEMDEIGEQARAMAEEARVQAREARILAADEAREARELAMDHAREAKEMALESARMARVTARVSRDRTRVMRDRAKVMRERSRVMRDRNRDLRNERRQMRKHIDKEVEEEVKDL